MFDSKDVLNVRKKKGRKIIKADKEKKLVMPESLTKESVKQWIENLNQQTEDPEEKRKTNREGKKYEFYGSYFSMGDNSLQINPKTMQVDWRSGQDLGAMIFSEIYNHGRKTIDELAENISSANINLITIVANMMIKDDLLLNYVEEDGTETLELVDMKEKQRRGRERGELEDKTVPDDIDVTPDPDSMI